MKISEEDLALCRERDREHYKALKKIAIDEILREIDSMYHDYASGIGYDQNVAKLREDLRAALYIFDLLVYKKYVR